MTGTVVDGVHAAAGDLPQLVPLVVDAARRVETSADVIVLGAVLDLARAVGGPGGSGRAGAQPDAPRRGRAACAAHHGGSGPMTASGSIALGCIADDYTGGTDVAAALRRAGLRTVLLFGEPDDGAAAAGLRRGGGRVEVANDPRRRRGGGVAGGAGAVRRRGVRQTYFKYCSTFDSTDAGNIGPVTDALVDARRRDSDHDLPGLARARPHDLPRPPLRRRRAAVGVVDAHHPLTPMTDPNLVRVLSRQTPHRVGLHRPRRRARGPGGDRPAARRARRRWRARTSSSTRSSDADLDAVAGAAGSLPLLTGGAGLAGALGAAVAGRRRHGERAREPAAGARRSSSPAAARRRRSARSRTRRSGSRRCGSIPPRRPTRRSCLAGATAWLGQQLGDGPVLVYSSAGPEQRAAARAAMGPDVADHLEHILGQLARAAVGLGVRRRRGGRRGDLRRGGRCARRPQRSVVTAEEDRGVPWCVTAERAAARACCSSRATSAAPDLLRAARWTEVTP